MSPNHRSEASSRGVFFQFSVRTFLWLFTATIVMAWIGRQAMRGSEILVAIAGLLLLAVGFIALCVLFFLIGWLPAFVSHRKGSADDAVLAGLAEPPQLPDGEPPVASEASPRSPGPPAMLRHAAPSPTPVQE
ncbi:hypothetical protein [Roseimaritima ulvae]|uniref:Uncharacterized protein n=1 Tax=Roseimaritima ulvae TaxID=980254 RepID=A0A5B9QU77_9BACT|nr:hypothetical protein [Roseimaritima ulvae]QEG41492.1 hypothetical protein UC8_35150 [Roseimaritima ulvae]